MSPVCDVALKCIPPARSHVQVSADPLHAWRRARVECWDSLTHYHECEVDVLQDSVSLELLHPVRGL